MYSVRIRTLLVVGLVLVAGCAGGGDVVSPPDGAEATPGADGEMADGGSATDDSDRIGGDDLELGDPETALREAGSFTVTWRYAGVDPGGVETAVDRAFSADLFAGRSYTTISSTRDGQPDGGASEQFVTDGVTYVRSGSGEDATYVSYESAADVVGMAVALSQARSYGASDRLGYRGSETFDGVTVQRYELTEVDEALVRAGSVASAGEANDFELTDFEYVVLVDDDGLPRYERWAFAGRTADGRSVAGEWEYSLTDLGTTTVEEPDWLAAAQTQQIG